MASPASTTTTAAAVTLSSSQSLAAVRAAVRQWTSQNLISSSLAARLLDTLEVEGGDDDDDSSSSSSLHDEGNSWRRFAKYAFRLAVLSLTIALVSVLADRAFMQSLKRRLLSAVPAWARSVLTAAVAACVHYRGYRRQTVEPREVWTNESMHALGGLVVGLAALQLAEARGLLARDRSYPRNHTHESVEVRQRQWEEWKRKQAEKKKSLYWILLLLATIYGGTGLVTRSNFIWSCSMIVLGAWFGAVNGYLMGTYFVGMSHPSHFVLFGLGLVGVGHAMRRWECVAALWSSTRIWGLLYLFIALWILSIFGNDQLFSEKNGKWASARRGQGRLFLWSLVFGLAAGYCIVHGMHFHDETLKGFGLTFLGINLYTKFFEYFWSSLYKPLFFAVLAGTLVVVGRYAERVWNLQLQT